MKLIKIQKEMIIKKNRFRFFLFSLFVSVFLISFVSANNVNFTVNSGNFFNIGTNTLINVTVGAMSENISRVSIWFASGAGFNGESFVLNSNGTSASNSSFMNSTNGAVTLVHNYSFYNLTPGGIIANGTTRTFWVEVDARQAESQISDIRVNATGTSTAIVNVSSAFTLYPGFTFTGTVLNETGCSTCYQNDTNVTIYGILPNPNGPRSATALSSVLSNNSGYYKIEKINASASYQGYQVKFVYYNATGTATKVGPILPDFPKFMYYDQGFGDSGFDMSLNGGSFYLQPATTINISANNGSTQISFGYQLIDQSLGFPIEFDIMSKKTNVTLIVPANRAYTVSFFRFPGFPGGTSGYQQNSTYCGDHVNGIKDFMNDTWCPSPPKSYSITAGSATAGAVININQTLTIRKAWQSGCINIASGVNNSALNITEVGIKMVPWTTSTGIFIPPSKGDDNSINLTSNINYTATGCTFAQYNFSLLNNTSYFVEIYAKKAMNASGNPGSSWNLAGFMNITALDNDNKVNITLYRLIGSHYNTSTSGVPNNISLMKINLVNSSGGAYTNPVNANLKVKHSASGIGVIYYMIDQNSISNGTFFIPVLNNSNFAKIMVFSNDGPPKETSINLSANEYNITIRSMSIDKGFRKFHSNGSVETINTGSMPISMRFLRNTAECYVANAPSSCEITSFNASSFNPMKALTAGKVHMEIKITSTNVTLLFQDYDMMSAKQPPMESTFDEAPASSSTSGTRKQDNWNFGSFAPVDSYTNVTIIMPYSDTTTASNYIDDSNPVNLSIPILYDENSNPIWNASRGDLPENLTDDFSSYNNTYYRKLLNSTGISVNTTNHTDVTFINTTGNYIQLRVPHFSTLSASVVGTGASSGSSSSSSSSGGDSGGSGTATTTFWKITYDNSKNDLKEQGSISREFVAGGRMKIKVNGEIHHVGAIEINNNNVKINISSTPQQAVIKLSESKKFNLDDDTYYDLLVKLNSINGSKANLTVSYIYETMPVEVVSPEKAQTGKGIDSLKIADNRSGTATWTLGIIILVLLVGWLVYRVYNRNNWIHKIKIHSTKSKSIKVH